MPSQLHNAAPFSGSIFSYLEAVFPDGKINTVSVCGNEHAPLLILEAGHILVAFAFESTGTYESYDALYSGFKKHYVDQKGNWDAFEISFIHCVAPESPGLAKFCSIIETDIYFCRKFVIPINESNIGGSLARLPFMPLDPLSGSSLRPQSAQTFLQQRGVPAELAKHIVVPGRGEDSILKDCLNGRFGKPKELSLTVSKNEVELKGATEQVRLSSVTIENFRAYRKAQKFNLGDAVTVLYGPNGFGKTSFFDAIDFAVTGSIGRINPSSFRKVAQHLDSDGEKSSVSLSFSGAHGPEQIVRDVSDPNNALLDGFPLDRKSILAQLTGSQGGKVDRVEHLVRLFRATHLFSQEQQELASDFHQNCEISADIVSRMLAFEDYVGAVKKAGKVKDRISHRKGLLQENIGRLTGLIRESKENFDQLNVISDKGKSIESLEIVIENVKEEVKGVGIELLSDQVDLAVITGWRADLESRLSVNKSYRKRLSLLIKDVASLPAEPSEAEEEIAQLEKDNLTNRGKRGEAEGVFLRAEDKLRQNFDQILAYEEAAKTYKWMLSITPAYIKLVEEERGSNDLLRKKLEVFSAMEKDERLASKNLQAADMASSKNIEGINLQAAKLKLLRSLSEELDVWVADTSKLQDIDESEKSKIAARIALSKEEDEIKQKIAFVREQTQLREQVIDAADKDQTDLQNLLSQLSSHVTGKDCPLCGMEHKSMDDLVQRIHSRASIDSASSERAELAELERQSNALSAELLGKSLRKTALEKEVVDLGEKRKLIEEGISRFLGAAKSYDIIFTSSGITPTEQLDSMIDQVETNISRLKEQSAIDIQILNLAGKEFEKSSKLTSDKRLEIETIQSDIEKKQLEIDSLKDDKRLVNLTLDIKSIEVEELMRTNQSNLISCRKLVDNGRATINANKQIIESLSRKISSVDESLLALRTKIIERREKFNLIFGVLTELKLPHEIGDEELLHVQENESLAYEKLLTLRDKVSSLELAVDTATTAAALVSLQQGINEKEQSVVQEKKKLKDIEPWAVYFNEISRLLSDQQNESTSKFTIEYGPRTSVIQRRLRSVYGFDDVEIVSRSSSIEVRVTRNGEMLRPIDYFSQSQQQSLLLGLFLAACSSQTWSSFSPIFLDDPVTHFDDLNTYALLDLIVGLLSTQFGVPQFVISTCDERLFQLARQKFSHLEAAAKFYRFSAIGEDGPVVEEL